jgi:hypothetical protein
MQKVNAQLRNATGECVSGVPRWRATGLSQFRKHLLKVQSELRARDARLVDADLQQPCSLTAGWSATCVQRWAALTVEERNYWTQKARGINMAVNADTRMRQDGRPPLPAGAVEVSSSGSGSVAELPDEPLGFDEELERDFEMALAEDDTVYLADDEHDAAIIPPGIDASELAAALEGPARMLTGSPDDIMLEEEWLAVSQG